MKLPVGAVIGVRRARDLIAVCFLGKPHTVDFSQLFSAAFFRAAPAQVRAHSSPVPACIHARRAAQRLKSPHFEPARHSGRLCRKPLTMYAPCAWLHSLPEKLRRGCSGLCTCCSLCSYHSGSVLSSLALMSMSHSPARFDLPAKAAQTHLPHSTYRRRGVLPQSFTAILTSRVDVKQRARLTPPARLSRVSSPVCLHSPLRCFPRAVRAAAADGRPARPALTPTPCPPSPMRAASSSFFVRSAQTHAHSAACQKYSQQLRTHFISSVISALPRLWARSVAQSPRMANSVVYRGQQPAPPLALTRRKGGICINRRIHGAVYLFLIKGVSIFYYGD